MANFIEELFYGNIDPQARGYRKDHRVIKVSDNMNDIEEKLTDSKFIRSHKSFIINMDYVSRIEPYGRWTYIVKFNGKDYDALITSSKYDEIKKIYG